MLRTAGLSFIVFAIAIPGTKKEKEPNFSGYFVCYGRLSVEICPQYRWKFPLQFTRTINGYVDCHPVGIVTFTREMPGSLPLRYPHEFRRLRIDFG